MGRREKLIPRKGSFPVRVLVVHSQVPVVPAAVLVVPHSLMDSIHSVILRHNILYGQ